MSTFEHLVADLTRDVLRAQPRDVLQFCASWFNSRLEEQRTRMRDILSSTSHPNIDVNLFEDVAPHASGPPTSAQSPLTANAAPRPSLVLMDGTPVLTNPFGPQSQLHTYAPNQHPPTTNSGISKRPFGSVPFVTIREDEALSPHAFTNPFESSPFENKSNEAPPPSDSLLPPGLLGRRVSVSAESIIPNSHSDTPLPFHPKSTEQIARIKAAIKENFIFRDLEEKQLQSILGAMEETHVADGEVVIRQGDHGDYFYVVESGRLEVYITSETLPLHVSPEQAKQKGGLAGYHPIFGKKVAENGPGSSFGELALMYGHPRAATVLAVEPSTLWRLDRMSFRTIILKAAHKRRTMYEEFLSTVPLLSSLSPEERSKIADALMSWTVEDGDAVIEEGQVGDMFYFVEEGEAIVTKKQEDGSEKTVNTYKKGDYFGELALLRLEPRAATVRAVVREGSNEPKLKVAALGVAAFTRLLGPIRDIMERNAGEAYGGRYN
ncbi:cAMP-dependent protein kinase regulatory subunit Short=PKA regulatory subunit [Serendipita indica DSM 11827]|uniref:cAMP-dependent protein kinase regulatory subunit n=1 Tax=Serendipita indica (strain DSM 11827) TaxID=1109443 RepID=G4TW49_SERID|nr:cAMP-dependent protein kinase regulatory subunit Short=PKA regulatory subunit [Serendipita indica DSM 11827]CCA75542.1 related to cAMP-dependent protein kinase type II regulatory chain [Serendipita indica DSM 11827]